MWLLQLCSLSDTSSSFSHTSIQQSIKQFYSNKQAAPSAAWARCPCAPAPAPPPGPPHASTVSPPSQGRGLKLHCAPHRLQLRPNKSQHVSFFQHLPPKSLHPPFVAPGAWSRTAHINTQVILCIVHNSQHSGDSVHCASIVQYS